MTEPLPDRHTAESFTEIIRITDNARWLDARAMVAATRNASEAADRLEAGTAALNIESRKADAIEVLARAAETACHAAEAFAEAVKLATSQNLDKTMIEDVCLKSTIALQATQENVKVLQAAHIEATNSWEEIREQLPELSDTVKAMTMASVIAAHLGPRTPRPTAETLSNCIKQAGPRMMYRNMAGNAVRRVPKFAGYAYGVEKRCQPSDESDDNSSHESENKLVTGSVNGNGTENAGGTKRKIGGLDSEESVA